MKQLVLSLFILSSSCIVYGQSNIDSSLMLSMRSYTEKSVTLLTGVNFQQQKVDGANDKTRTFYEIGVHKTKTFKAGFHPASSVTQGISFEISNDIKTIVGFKYSAWAQAWCFVAGFSTIYYTNFEKGNFKVRPEFGIGASVFKLTVGYNIPTLFNADFKELKQSGGHITLNILLKLKTTSIVY